MKNHEASEQLKQERLALSVVEQKLGLLIASKISSRPETTLALRSGQLASMWLGKALGVLKVKHPYPESFDPTSKVIENRADVADVDPIAFAKSAEDEIGFVKGLRHDLKVIEGQIENDSLILTDNKKYQACIQTSWTHCCNATMWLGMVLNAIKKEEIERENLPKSLQDILDGEPNGPTDQDAIKEPIGSISDGLTDPGPKTDNPSDNDGEKKVDEITVNPPTPAAEPGPDNSMTADERTKTEAASEGTVTQAPPPVDGATPRPRKPRATQQPKVKNSENKTEEGKNGEAVN